MLYATICANCPFGYACRDVLEKPLDGGVRVIEFGAEDVGGEGSEPIEVVEIYAAFSEMMQSLMRLQMIVEMVTATHRARTTAQKMHRSVVASKHKSISR